MPLTKFQYCGQFWPLLPATTPGSPLSQGFFLKFFFGKERASRKAPRRERKRQISRKTSGTRVLPDVPINNTIFKKKKEMIDISINFPKSFFVGFLSLSQIKLFSPNAVDARQNTIVFPGEWGHSLIGPKRVFWVVCFWLLNRV